MVNVTDAQLEAAEGCGREMLKTEPRALAAHYDRTTGRVVVDLISGCATRSRRRSCRICRVQPRRSCRRRGRWSGVQPALAGTGRRSLCAGADDRSLRHPRLDGARACTCRRSSDLAGQSRGIALERYEGRPSPQDRPRLTGRTYLSQRFVDKLNNPHRIGHQISRALTPSVDAAAHSRRSSVTIVAP